jgi:hypothetical protein
MTSTLYGREAGCLWFSQKMAYHKTFVHDVSCTQLSSGSFDFFEYVMKHKKECFLSQCRNATTYLCNSKLVPAKMNTGTSEIEDETRGKLCVLHGIKLSAQIVRWVTNLCFL